MTQIRDAQLRLDVSTRTPAVEQPDRVGDRLHGGSGWAEFGGTPLGLPDYLSNPENEQTAIPRLAKDPAALDVVADWVQSLGTKHRLIQGDARDLPSDLDDEIDLVVTSPPYWNLKDYPDSDGQLGNLPEYDEFLAQLETVWRNVSGVLRPGGRLVIVVGDVLLSRRRNGRHTVVPLHASILEQCRRIGLDNLAPIIWYKIGNAKHEVQGNGAGFLGKPYEPNAVVKNDIEYILMQRKGGGYRSPSFAARVGSVIPSDVHKEYFQQVWQLPGASTRRHPAPFPESLAERLVRMFSFIGDTVLDPFMGTGSVAAACAKWGRNSVGLDVEESYVEMARSRLETSSPYATLGLD